MAAVLPHSARQFARAIVMPNLRPPITTVAAAGEYRARILAALPAGVAFDPLMTLYLTDSMSPHEVRRAAASGFVHAVKLYPAGATTNSDSGVTDIARSTAVLAAIEDCGLPLLVHGEVTDPAVDVFDREKVFIERVLQPLLLRHPGIRLVFEHITTGDAAAFVRDCGDNVAATITAHHLLYNRNAIFAGGICPHHYCLPVLKRERHRQALLQAATSGNPKFFLGTDSAPHSRASKESACGCAGCYTAPAALELYAEAFESMAALDRLEPFASFHGADFYRLPRNVGQVTLQQEEWLLPAAFTYADGDALVPLRAGEALRWRLLD
jgi:dihydroorotase